jgi:hypothetical protein
MYPPPSTTIKKEEETLSCSLNHIRSRSGRCISCGKQSRQRAPQMLNLALYTNIVKMGDLQSAVLSSLSLVLWWGTVLRAVLPSSLMTVGFIKPCLFTSPSHNSLSTSLGKQATTPSISVGPRN